MKSNRVARISLLMLVLLASAASGATIVLSNATGMQSNGFANTRIGPGTSGGSNFQNYALFSYKVQDILSATGLTVGDLATATFTFSFDTDASIDLIDAGGGSTYRIIYAGFFANTGNFANAPLNGGSSLLGSTVTAVNTGVNDTLTAQTGISADFNLTGITEGDSGDDWIGFRVAYESYVFQGSNTYQPLLNYTLTGPDPVPEPSAVLLGALGSLLLLRRRR